MELHSFNTSHVTLYLCLFEVPELPDFGFNTSHVTLYRTAILDYGTEYICFNTSHVTLYPVLKVFIGFLFPVSIHLMLLFIGVFTTENQKDVSFNTSHVTLYRR